MTKYLYLALALAALAAPAERLGRIDHRLTVAELRGDIFAAQGKTAEARNSYDLALQKFDALTKDDEARQRGGYKEVVQSKRDALGAAK